MAAHEDQNASDLELVRRIKRGDEQGFREMVDRYHARVYSLAYGVLRNTEDAEEATQDAFLTLYRKIGTFDESKKFFSWFYRVALNAAYSRARRRKPGITVSIDDYLPRFKEDGHAATVELATLAEGAEDEAIARNLADRAEGFIAELPKTYRDAIWMVDVEEMKPADVAEVLRISLAALKSRLHRARLYVRQRLLEVAAATVPTTTERRAAP
jgi:RNA polymerase sigma-70 factor (ECF subfamily)